MSATTRFSLIARIKDPEDAVSWGTFVQIYSPFVYSIGRRYGLQDADACDLVQEVMREVAGSIGRFDANSAAGKFRGWLSLVTRRTLSRMLKKNQKAIAKGSGDTVQLMALGQHPAEEDD
ncbi:MAG: sigma-70 family RNA polymerase sigma factor, partial [Planctomycetota bacterium]